MIPAKIRDRPVFDSRWDQDFLFVDFLSLFGPIFAIHPFPFLLITCGFVSLVCVRWRCADLLFWWLVDSLPTLFCCRRYLWKPQVLRGRRVEANGTDSDLVSSRPRSTRGCELPVALLSMRKLLHCPYLLRREQRHTWKTSHLGECCEGQESLYVRRWQKLRYNLHTHHQTDGAAAAASNPPQPPEHTNTTSSHPIQPKQSAPPSS
jgi:hypothetical protein